MQVPALLFSSCGAALMRISPDNRRQERYERFAARRCAGCGKGELPTRSICSRCRNACYCSPVCQKAHWKEHKQYCQSPELPTS
ncbi:hypothetical protein FB451DRAFT_1245920 [Mycena latifolia]|nr:hypothetical protein FB451DRAFT_1245920 [Mycena latifolia]